MFDHFEITFLHDTSRLKKPSIKKSMVSKQLTMLFMISKEVSFRIYILRMSWQG